MLSRGHIDVCKLTFPAQQGQDRELDAYSAFSKPLKSLQTEKDQGKESEFPLTTMLRGKLSTTSRRAQQLSSQLPSRSKNRTTRRCRTRNRFLCTSDGAFRPGRISKAIRSGTMEGIRCERGGERSLR